MKTVQRTALLPYGAEQIYALVDHIEAYPQFMHGCVGTEVFSREGDQVKARLDLKRGKFAYSLTTQNTHTPGKRIDMHLADGPFKSLEGVWLFEDIGGQGCRVSFDLSFEFKNRLVGMAAGSWFEGLANELVDAVCERANVLYR